MNREKSAGAVIYRCENGIPLYLLLHYPSSVRATSEYWDLPKGHVEKGETEEETVRREVQEETGIVDITFVAGFREEIHYWFQWKEKKISKTVIFFLAETKEEQVVISDEHINFVWLPYNKAIEKLTYKNAKQLVQKSHDIISAKGV